MATLHLVMDNSSKCNSWVYKIQGQVSINPNIWCKKSQCMTYKKFKICYVLVYTLHVEEHVEKSQVD